MNFILVCVIQPNETFLGTSVEVKFDVEEHITASLHVTRKFFLMTGGIWVLVVCWIYLADNRNK